MALGESFDNQREGEPLMHVLGYACVAVVLFGCTASEHGGQPPERTVVGVELLAFSGRENPQWELSDKEVDELIRRVSDLSPGPPPPEPPGLGYSGFQITTSGRHTALPETINVYHGVRLGPPGDGATRQDDRGLERWLLGLARQRNYGELIDALGL
jgi:hypothetical protein